MLDNKNLNTAKTAKNDEFYTQLIDIEKELEYYKDQLQGKVIYCNCDNPEWSNFWKYFESNFEHIRIKKLISTHYEKEHPTYKLEMAKNEFGEIIKTTTPLKENGDFRSPECIEILKESDIVVTNPPFSLFREYVGQLIEYNKKFIILGNINAVAYKDIFPLIKSGNLWLGETIHNGGREFRVPDYYQLNATDYRQDEVGNKYIRVKGVRWFTNIATKKNYEDIALYKTYNEADYPKYDNYDAINVNKVKEIPIDYGGIMGVPITFIDKYNPNQFEIIGMGKFTINKKPLYTRILIKKKIQTDEK